QVRAKTWDGGKAKAETARKAFADWLATGTRARLSAIAHHDGDENDACIVSPEARYRGVENQLYRVEIHSAPAPDAPEKDGPVRFKWSRDNGSIVIPLQDISGTTAHVRSLGRDTRTSLSPRDYVEVV